MIIKDILNYKISFVILSLLVFGFSLFKPAITYQDYDGIAKMEGYNMFLVGSTAILGGGLLEWIIWLANPFSLLTIILLLTNQPSGRTTAMISLILSSSFLLWRKILISESGREAIILERNSGYWLWLFSIAILTYGVYKLIKPIKKIDYSQYMTEMKNNKILDQ